MLKLKRIPREQRYTVEGRKFKSQQMAAHAHEEKHKHDVDAPVEKEATKAAPKTEAPKKTAKPPVKKAAKAVEE